MAVFEMESWFVAEGKEEAHDQAMRGWLKWVHEHRDLFPEWKSIRYFAKTVAGEESGRRFILWEYDNRADYEAYKERRADYEGPYEEYKKHDPYYMEVFAHGNMKLEFWKDVERDLWIE
jgi:hypothetical protein